ncbi:MAG: mechanosensitive ion channel family protein [Gemmatimonadales bacterium]
MPDVTTSNTNWLWTVVTLAAAPLAAMVLHWVLFKLARRLAGFTHSAIDELLVEHARRPTAVLFPAVALLFVLPDSGLPPGILDLVDHLISLTLIAICGWLVIELFAVIDDLLIARYPMTAADNLRARRVLTQVGVLRRIAIMVVSIVTAAVMLMTFPSVRHIGDSLLASAGLAGLVVGFAAKPTLSSLIAGVQLALSEPIRIEDVVIVEGEWGWIEEIRTTFVVVRTWDLRRLIVPLSYFIEHPFQNWTRKTADLIGTVLIYTDYRVPVAAIRTELDRIVHATDLWNGKVVNVQVTDATEHALQIRALVSASDSSKAWDLRCLVREQLIDFLQQKYPESLPKTRIEMQGGKEGRREGGNGNPAVEGPPGP